MTRYILRRVLLLMVTMLVTSVIIFALTQLLPGDVARLILGRDALPEAVDALREDLGLNRPVVEQYINWLGGFVSGDWGNSFTSGSPPVRPLVMDRLGNSLKLALVAFVISVPLSIVLGVVAALKEDTWIDSAISLLTLSVVGLPEFVTGVVLVNVFALELGWLPATTTLTNDMSFGATIHELMLPAITATLVLLGYVVRLTRAGVIDELKKPYVRTAILKGLPRRQVIVKHVLRNALLPTITVIAISVGWLIGGIIVIENVFNYPGLGTAMTDAVHKKNLPVLQAIVMVTVFFFAFANLAADILYAVLNPRIRME